ncbi:acyl-CoA thioester hydrolase [Pontibacter ummariensis]|uniref:Acyl-CoA thioester hydrolase n=1 Tax=Pontibacter ummariensis TaxID=1610492 RepID=A0A239IA79_9BACT|nr:acyl-CoA thioesterase [Pontibacter ummariensis]PRY09972.1 acyl-CoA thioester hydrolase [Pontibacter ummariensis]SNS90218.1 acyl-CoA thioester hydrolase [Pontibacter ummariensis]
MNNVYEGKVMWSHLDANMHMRHSAYADFAAQARIEVLDQLGLDLKMFQKLHIGPILFREELKYLREVGVNDNLKVTTELIKSRPDASRWSIRHEVFRQDGVKAAVIEVDGAWIDVLKRKLAQLPEELAAQFAALPKSEDYEELPA